MKHFFLTIKGSSCLSQVGAALRAYGGFAARAERIELVALKADPPHPQYKPDADPIPAQYKPEADPAPVQYKPDADPAPALFSFSLRVQRTCGCSFSSSAAPAPAAGRPPRRAP